MGRGGLASKSAVSGLLALPVKAKAEPEGDEYDETSEADDDARAAELGDALKSAYDAGDGAGITRAIVDILDWYQGEEPEPVDEEAEA